MRPFHYLRIYTYKRRHHTVQSSTCHFIVPTAEHQCSWNNTRKPNVSRSIYATFFFRNPFLRNPNTASVSLRPYPPSFSALLSIPFPLPKMLTLSQCKFNSKPLTATGKKKGKSESGGKGGLAPVEKRRKGRTFDL